MGDARGGRRGGRGNARARRSYRPSRVAVRSARRSSRLRELVAAVALEPTRPVEGRLTGGFKYAPPPSPTRGAAEHEVSTGVRIAAAAIEARVGTEDTPESLGALGLAYLAVGETARAVQCLERAATAEPVDPRRLSDLAAALIAEGERDGKSDDVRRAAAIAGQALQVDPRLKEAQFNLALAFQRLGLNAQATDAWHRYQDLDRDSEWRREAEARLASGRGR